MNDITLIEKAQVDIANIFLILVVIAFIMGILCIIFSKEKKWVGVPLLIIPSIMFFMAMMGNKEFGNKLDGFMKALFEFVYEQGYTIFTILAFAIVIFIFGILPILGGKNNKNSSGFGTGFLLGWLFGSSN